MANGCLTRSTPSMCGNINTVSPMIVKGCGNLADVVEDPQFYIPEQDVVEGLGKLTKEETGPIGFWTSTLTLDDRRLKIVGFTKGPLNGFVKIPANELGKSPDSVHGHLLTIRRLVRGRRETLRAAPQGPIQAHRVSYLLARGPHRG